ncbi:GNAT family N-acetyltransferase [Nocardia altamirensis]|uniref:GNAT family N-acetyltransferase n=1 Tax=Nocardia altamirensis TaxID=472158 RepID=UPI0008406A38|nr:GNAT family N-acetyltransferase [Nocardia altamirensis]
MSSASPLQITSLSPDQAADFDLVCAVVALINEVYEVAEEGLWANGHTRTTTDDIAALIRADEITVAHLDNELVGVVRIRRIDQEVSEFGMLAAAPKRRGLGIGRELVRFAEQRGRDSGASSMQLELLVPREWTHPSKEFLTQWYTRLGYTAVHTGQLADSYPELTPRLTTPCHLITYRKPFL